MCAYGGFELNLDYAANAVPDALKHFFAEHPKIALAFSGGCDSAYLFYAAVCCGVQVAAYYVKSCFQPAFELRDAQALADALKQELHVLHADVLSDAQVRKNPPDRCYFCKKRIFSGILEAARADGYDAIMDGTNASDDASDRPGMRALAQMQVLSPLRMCGIDKAQVRALSQNAGLFTWNKPAYACLATRVPTGMPISAQLLERVERAEESLFRLGFSDFRVRVSAQGARLELTKQQMYAALEKREDILAALENDFSEITLNLRPRRGAGE